MTTLPQNYLREVLIARKCSQLVENLYSPSQFIANYGKSGIRVIVKDWND
jgi:hypothetical protein